MAEGLNNPVDLLAIAEQLIADETPSAEVTGGSAGVMTKAQGARHSHPRLTSTTYATISADATATVMFTRTFTNKPGVVMTEVDQTGTQPLVCVVQSFIQSGGLYTGCVIKGYRSQALPTQTQLSVLALLGAVVSGVNNLAASLTGFNIFGGTATGATVSVIAIARSDVSSS